MGGTGRSSDTAPQLPRSSAARTRVLEAADRLFYGEGIRAVAVDRVIAEARVTRVTFYRHFRSKDELIAAYLRGRLHRDQDVLAQLRRDHVGDPGAILDGVASQLAADLTASGFRGCPYANLAAEYCDVDHPARQIAGEHRDWLRREVEDLLEALALPRPALTAEQLVMLRAGAMAVASVGSPDHVASAFADAWQALISRDS